MAEEVGKIEKVDAEAPVQRLDFVGMDQVVAISADAFLVGKGEDVFSIMFFQHQIPAIMGGALGTGSQLDSTQTKCVSRVTISPSGFRKLLNSMAGVGGFEVAPREQEGQ